MVSLGEAGIVIQTSEISEWINQIHSKGEEYVIIDKYLLLLWLIRIERH